MTNPGRSVASGLVMSISLALTVATLIIGSGYVGAMSSIVTLLFVVIGAFLAVRAEGNVVAWLLVSFGLLLGATEFFEAVAGTELAGAAWAAFVASVIWLPALLTLLVMVPIFFPDGRLLGRGWSWVVWATAIGCVSFLAGNAFTDELLSDYQMANPVSADLAEPLIEAFRAVGVTLLAVSIVAAISSAVIRFRKSSGVERQQMKWFAFAAVLLIPAVVVNGWAYEADRAVLGLVVVLVAALGVATSITLAILRYRLYDIDRIVSRTVIYGLVVLLLGSLFAVGVVYIPNLMMSGEAPPWLVAATTLGVAALFNPLRRRLQATVDRRFNRSKYDGERVADRFARSLRDDTDADVVVDGWVGVVIETMQPVSLGVWVRHRSRLQGRIP